MKNIIFFFSGTGNSLSIAKRLAEKIGDCEIVPMGMQKPYLMKQRYEKIGFVYPVYFMGIPMKVRKFVSELPFHLNKNAYVFGISTKGGSTGNSISQLGALLKKKGVVLSYGTSLRMFSNYVVMYKMSKNVEKAEARVNKKFNSAADDIINQKRVHIKKPMGLIESYYRRTMKRVPKMDMNYNIDDTCTGCGVCANVCPVDNITMMGKKPRFNHRCEQCVACIQYCPQKALNYKDKTQKRGRYHNPAVSSKELERANHSMD